MTRTWTLLLGLVTLWPLVYIVISFVMIGGMMVYSVTAEPESSGDNFFAAVFLVFVSLHMLTMVILIALIAIYLIHLFKTDRVPEDKKALWAVVLILGNMLAMPVYWYLYVRHGLGSSPTAHEAS